MFCSEGRGCTFLASPRKVPKEGDIGEALSSALPRRKPPSPMYHSRRTLSSLWRVLSGKTCCLVAFFLIAAAPLSPLCRFFFDTAQQPPFGQKRRNTFCPNRIEDKTLQSHRKCAPGVSKGGGSGAGATSISAPLAAFFGYFLGGTRK